MFETITISDFESICRLCLTRDVTFRQLFKSDTKRIYKNGVLSYIKVLIDPKISSSDGLPTQICEICYKSLTSFASYRRRCIKSIATLQNIIKDYEIVKVERNIELSSSINTDFPVSGSNNFKQEGNSSIDSTTEPHEERTVDTTFNQLCGEDNKEIDLDLNLVKIERIYYNDHEPEPSAEVVDVKPKRHRREVTKKSKPIIDGRDEENARNESDNDEDFEIAHLKRRRRSQKSIKNLGDPKNNRGSELSTKRKNRSGNRKIRPKSPVLDRIQTELELFPENGADKPCAKYNKDKQMCPLCGDLYYNIHNHMRTHNSEKNFACEECGKAFKTKGTLKTHKLAIHLQIRRFKCSICQSLFKSKTTLKMHRIVHTGERKFECKICGRLVTTISSYQNHMLTHTQERNHECPHCHKKFITNQRLHHHMPKHTGEKIFQCGICTERFRYSSAATHHRRRHMNHNNAYACTYCEREFKDMRRFIIHHQSIHNVKLPLVENGGIEAERCNEQ